MLAIAAVSRRAAAALRIARSAARGDRVNGLRRESRTPGTRRVRISVWAKALLLALAVAIPRRRMARANRRARMGWARRKVPEVRARRMLRAASPRQHLRPSSPSIRGPYRRAAHSCRLAVPIWRSAVGTAATSCSCAAMRMSTIPRSAWPSSRACLRRTTIRWA